ncbi:reprolysin-like metallopeptidase [Sphingomonas sp. BK481]|uniref:reprolysin-like metallopeptidase n=1 Tax=Sphingomonas sp. BK481 TaxID=2586981 RepID=UPI00160E4A1E|nr:matrix metalloproteinase-11 [Sphingomonas sp. BK481]MBB3587738.1 hypothetical protein [Sphingomonas sp. BK481]
MPRDGDHAQSGRAARKVRIGRIAICQRRRAMTDRKMSAFANNDAVGNIFELNDDTDFLAMAEDTVHVFRGHVCDTEHRGHIKSATELVVDASDGFIPVWQQNSVLRWRFQRRSLLRYRYPDQIKVAARTLLAAAVSAWGDAAPIRFIEDDDAWDFEIAVRDANSCSVMGCTLASAFFPGEAQQELVIYPMMFQQDTQEQIETLAHEIGHIFGLRHFFALEKEQAWPAELFGAHEAISIMNYGEQSQLTDTDRADLKLFYAMIWSGQLKDINRTPIRQMKPFSANRP